MTTLAARLAFMESQAAHIESRVRMVQHGSIQYPQLVGISREANPHADSIVYYSYDGAGEMADLANRAMDYPFVETTQRQHTVSLQWSGLAYDFTDREVGQAMMLGLPLSDRKMRLAFRIAEEEKERTFLNGNSARGWDGILNQSDVPTRDATNSWDTATNIQIIDDILDMLTGTWVDTNQVRLADTLLMSPDQFSQLLRPMGAEGDRSIMDYVRQANPYTATTGNALMIRTLRQLKDYNEAGNDRVIAYTRDMDVLRYHVPQELQFIEPQRQGARWVYHGHMVLGGLEIMEPTALRYLDGV